jgi:hypothetical protein
VVVSQIDEQQLAVIPLAMNPSGESNGLANLVGTQNAARVSAQRLFRSIAHY